MLRYRECGNGCIGRSLKEGVADEEDLHRFRRGMQPELAQGVTLGQTPTAATGRVEGTVFVGVSSGQAFAAGATVRLSGPAALETETDEHGNYTFAAVFRDLSTSEGFLAGSQGMHADDKASRPARLFEPSCN